MKPGLAGVAAVLSLAALFTSLMLGGCATVYLSSEDAQGIRVHREAGVVGIEVSDPSQRAVVEMEGLGVFRSPLGFSAGLSRHRYVLPGDDCQVVVWVHDRADLAQWKDLAKGISGACVIAGDR